jgi:hypothetical protein
MDARLECASVALAVAAINIFWGISHGPLAGYSEEQKKLLDNGREPSYI